MTKNPEEHPAAAVWPMLPEADLRRLADDIASNGLMHPIVLDDEGRVLDGRNRLAACRLVDVEPEYETYDGDDPEGYVLSSNNERRHLSLPERAAATALTLFVAGKRDGGRWEYGAVNGTDPDSGNPRNWARLLTDAGLVLDYLGEGRLRRVAEGKEALDGAVQKAKAERELMERYEALPAELRALVDTGDLTIQEAERRNSLDERYARLVESGDLSLDEAESLSQREEREHRESVDRAKSAVESFLYGFEVASSLAKSPIRADVLSALDDHDRERFLNIEKETRWPSRAS